MRGGEFGKSADDRDQCAGGLIRQQRMLSTARVLPRFLQSAHARALGLSGEPLRDAEGDVPKRVRQSHPNEGHIAPQC